MMNPTSCVTVIEGESVGILIQLSNFSMTERLEIEILVDLNVFFGKFSLFCSNKTSYPFIPSPGIGSRPLHIVSGKNLSIPGSLVIAERVTGVFLLTKVCEILVDGTIINSEFTTNPGRSDCLKAAVGSLNIDSGVAQSITLIPPRASSEQRIATLFLISNFETCSPTVKKLSNVFTVNSKCSLNVIENNFVLSFIFCFFFQLRSTKQQLLVSLSYEMWCRWCVYHG